MHFEDPVVEHCASGIDSIYLDKPLSPFLYFVRRVTSQSLEQTPSPSILRTLPTDPKAAFRVCPFPPSSTPLSWKLFNFELIFHVQATVHSASSLYG
ncbi:hypothetical protein I313_04379 [Cryptococcus deuterogattii Ram5]|uniref:Uncharacterized protein n=1 Tax=Cryptococcus deuterogattii Ram5 TaxID=1296110 RepID=A0A0D0V0A5_9TREE|nr:hypothetical protein I313_04379 [Cryptococcus deuterogattii Ram5]KIR90874.1 hypothetical protein I304_05527 [Cryptococcus deuterogattii CBS 10090]